MSKQPRSSKSLFLQRLTWGITGVTLFISALLIGYFLGFNQAEEELFEERLKTQQLREELSSLQKSPIPVITPKRDMQEREIRRLKKELQSILEREERHEPVKPEHEYAPKDKKALPPPSAERRYFPSVSGAKLVIIIDDVSYGRDVKAIQSTGLPLVMSFLPPSSRHPESGKLAQQQNRFMVHLPLEAVDFNDEESSTLRSSDTEETISKRIAALKQVYPGVRYMNNHTGSKFTADAEAMEKLMRVLKSEGIVFVDSRTTAKTKVPEISKKLGIRYLGRDVFLDHQDGVANVKKQIREAVEKAKRHGTAIAIGHPRPDTIRALKESKGVLGEVQLVGIDQI
jgi:hypothetical protein